MNSADRRGAVRLGLASVLGVGAALLVACGSGSSSLIPASSAGPLQSDFNAVASSVQAGDCVDTKSEVEKTRQDLASLPGTVNPQLLQTLTTGVQTLADRAATECKLNAGPSTTTTTAPTTVTTQTQTDTNTSTVTTPTNTNTNTTPTDTNTVPTTTGTTPTDTNTTPSTTIPGAGGPPGGVGGTQAPGTPTTPSDPSGGTPGGGT